MTILGDKVASCDVVPTRWLTTEASIYISQQLKLRINPVIPFQATICDNLGTVWFM